MRDSRIFCNTLPFATKNESRLFLQVPTAAHFSFSLAPFSGLQTLLSEEALVLLKGKGDETTVNRHQAERLLIQEELFCVFSVKLR